jgi:hypothetical protein
MINAPRQKTLMSPETSYKVFYGKDKDVIGMFQWTVPMHTQLHYFPNQF